MTETNEAHEGAQVLLVRLADDLDSGFAELMRAYQQVVYSVALRASGDPFDAEDLAAEAFLRAYRALRGFDQERILALRPRAWLLTIVLNTWRNWARDQSRRPRQTPLEEHADPPVDGPGVEELAERRETLHELSDLVAQLPEPQRIAVVLRHVAGLPIPEVAAVMGCPQGTAKSHVSRGLQRLRTLYRASPIAEVVSLEPISLPDADSAHAATPLPVSTTNTPHSPTPRREQR